MWYRHAMSSVLKWRKLVQDLEPNVPANRNLYVKSGTSPADTIVQDLLAAPGAFPKVLLVGARGGGKSSELRAISRALEGKARTVEIDLDRSGVEASSVSAFDILYVCALALLRFLPDDAQTDGFYKELSLRYAGGDTDRQRQLGELRTALSGIADFAGGAAKVAGAATALGAGAAPVAAGAIAVGVTSIGLRLLVGRAGEGGVVAETSPSGRALQETCVKIARRVREGDRLPLCVLIDGLEKINGEAGERFRQVFEQTRLLADTTWAAVIAAPPCTLTQTSCVDGRGFTTLPIWGFSPDDPAEIRGLLERRLGDSALDPGDAVEAGELDRIAERSGGHPRHAVQIARRAVLVALSQNAPRINRAHVDAGIQEVAQALGRGINTDHLMTLKRVAQTGRLPGDGGAATLFADGRILTFPPGPGSIIPRFAVHPLLKADVDAFVAEVR
jgi:hypothetical protein